MPKARDSQSTSSLRHDRDQFERDFALFVFTRLDRLDPYKTLPGYTELADAVENLREEIYDLLPEEAGNKLLELCDAYVDMAALATEGYYRLGFRDGIRMIVGNS